MRYTAPELVVFDKVASLTNGGPFGSRIECSVDGTITYRQYSYQCP